MQRLEGKVAIVTGGSSGIGKSICLEYAKNGAKVVVAARNIERSEAVVEEIKRNGGDAIFVKADLQNEDEIINLIKKTVEVYGKIDVMVNNAGIGLSNPIDSTSSADWDNVMNTNAKAVFLGIKYSISHILKTKGSIITVASMAAVKPLPMHYVYAASKAAASMVTKVAALDYASQGVRCNVICPGVVDTPIIATASPEVREAVAGSIPFGRLG